ncbi:glycosyl hydrolase family 32 [Streptomyces armeniacus]|uniref:glycosyl hydrolase family 32 n=1 Tax=Streptomyces armeniacus TaxID=83291 RepID=UPI001C9A9EA5|nr:glycosyl hydrolase family 32 [Streptomyces armeniacus]
MNRGSGRGGGRWRRRGPGPYTTAGLVLVAVAMVAAAVPATGAGARAGNGGANGAESGAANRAADGTGTGTAPADASRPQKGRNGPPKSPSKQGEWVGAGKIKQVYDTSREDPARYLNDHSVIKGPDGTWHMFGITGDQAAPGTAPDSAGEDSFAHATAPDLNGPWTTRDSVLTVDPDYGEDHLWAPHVIEHDGTYYMYYSGGGGDRDASINLATSKDLYNWTREPSGTLFRDGWVARDPMVVRVDDHWVMYYTATTTPDGGNHTVAYRTSKDLVHWGERHTAFTDLTTKDNSAPVTESPFVVERNGWWYLFIGPRGDGYVGTDVYRSKDPTRFELAGYAGHFPAHAPELVEDGGRWWATHTGWFQRGLHLAPLHWRSTPPLWHGPQNPAAARNADGRLEAFALDSDGSGLLRRAQSAPNGEWGEWTDFGEGPATVPTVAENADGALELFAVEDDGTLVHRRQSAPGGEWGPWQELGGGRAGAAPSVVRGPDGRLEMFGLAPGGAAVTHRKQTSPGGSWGTEEEFGGPAASPPAVAADADGRLQVFFVERGGARVSHRGQSAPGGGWGPWEKFGGAASGRPVVAANADGRLEVFLLNPYGDKISRRGQTAPGGAWGDWQDFGTWAGGSPSVARNADGRLEVFAVGPGNDYLSHRWQTEPSGGWSDWAVFGGPAQCTPTTVNEADGRLTVLALRPEGTGVSQRTQTAPSGGWSDWRGFAEREVGGTACAAAS